MAQKRARPGKKSAKSSTPAQMQSGRTKEATAKSASSAKAKAPKKAASQLPSSKAAVSKAAVSKGPAASPKARVSAPSSKRRSATKAQADKSVARALHLPEGLSASDAFVSSPKGRVLPLFVVGKEDYDEWRKSAPAAMGRWLAESGFRPRAGAASLLPGVDGPEGAVVVVGDQTSPWDYAGLPRILPPGLYDAEPDLAPEVADALCLGWALGCYRFERYKKRTTIRPQLLWPERAHRGRVLALAEGAYLCRDLVNTPASDLGPEELARASQMVGKHHGAKYKSIVGEELLVKNYPMIHAVGRASSRAPRLIDMTWGSSKHPKLTLVGKGVCFDTGGLDLKQPPYMKLMKKDMGGSALVLALAHFVMSRNLPVRLRVLIPAVENSVSGNAMRPSDVLATRKGITVEVGDTDAEGRLILADALTEAESEAPDLIIDAATLTGAARVAVGTGMPAIFASRDATWQALEEFSKSTHDPMWRLPLHEPYRVKLDSKIADICNIGDSYGGAITAALFLQEFTTRRPDWLHVDTMGFNLEPRPGRPVGGEALGLLALSAYLERRYAGI